MIPTTAVFAEILFVGFQAAAWLTLLLISIFGTPKLNLTVLDGWETPTVFLASVAAYLPDPPACGRSIDRGR